MIDAAGAKAGYGVPAVSGAVAVAVGFLGYRRLSRPVPQREGTHEHHSERKSGTWRNWAGNVTARPVREVAPASVEELSAAVRKAADDGLRVKAVGTGHSFTAAAATDGVLILHPSTGIRNIDRGAGTVTVEGGHPAEASQCGSRARGAVADEDGYIMSNGSGRDQHRNARHGPRLSLDRRADQGT